MTHLFAVEECFDGGATAIGGDVTRGGHGGSGDKRETRLGSRVGAPAVDSEKIATQMNVWTSPARSGGGKQAGQLISILSEPLSSEQTASYSTM